MSSLKTFVGAPLIAILVAGPAVALPSSTQDRIQTFAYCAGRISALEEQQRLFDGPASERTAARLRDFETLIAALLPYARDEGIDGPQILNWRIDAKMAQAQLLQTAVFGTDEDRARHARDLADSYIATCQQLLLGA